MKTAIVYGSGFTGHTRKMAEYLATRFEADLFNVKEMGDFPFEEYDRIVIGTNVYFRKAHKRIVEFATQYSDRIANKKPVLYICCGSKGEKAAEQGKAISDKLLIPTYFIFPNSGEKNKSGMPIAVEDLIAKIL